MKQGLLSLLINLEAVAGHTWTEKWLVERLKLVGLLNFKITTRFRHALRYQNGRAHGNQAVTERTDKNKYC